MKISLVHGLCLLLLGGTLLLGDRIELRNGDILSGTILSLDDENVRISTEYGTLTIHRELILRGEFGEEGEVPEVESPDLSIDEAVLYQFPFEESYRNLRTDLTPMEAHGLNFIENGYRGKGISSDGAGSYMTGRMEPLDYLKQFSLSFAAYPRESSRTQYLLSKWSSTSGTHADGMFALSYKQSNLVLYLVDGTGTYHTFIAYDILDVNTWTHIGLVFDGNQVLFYRNGELHTRQETEFSELFPSSAPLYVLTADPGDGHQLDFYNFSGYFDELAISPEALGAEAMRQIGSPGDEGP